MVIRDGKERRMAKPDRRITDLVCAGTKMDAEQLQRAAVKFAAKDSEAARHFMHCLRQALESR